MKLHFWSIGKANDDYVSNGITLFTKRITHYYPAEWKIIPAPKNSSALQIDELKKAEAATILDILKPADCLILLDEKGKSISSEQLSKLIITKAELATKNLIFLVGGAYGVNDEIIKRANFCWSLSSLVFPHQLVRLILAEQVYRACTIAKNEKYHHS